MLTIFLALVKNERKIDNQEHNQKVKEQHHVEQRQSVFLNDVPSCNVINVENVDMNLNEQDLISKKNQEKNKRKKKV